MRHVLKRVLCDSCNMARRRVLHCECLILSPGKFAEGYKFKRVKVVDFLTSAYQEGAVLSEMS